jgi:hypothetical protein
MEFGINTKGMERKATYILSIFGLLFLGIVLGARTPYVPFEELESGIFIYSSVVILFIFIVVFTLYKGTESKPAGFKYLANFYKQGNYKQFLFSLISIPAFSFLMGYFVYMLVATLPAYPTKVLVDTNEEIPATCIKTGRNKTRGAWSLFRLYNGEEWKVSSYGHVCPNTQKVCRLTVSTGTLGYYVRGVTCS